MFNGQALSIKAAGALMGGLIVLGFLPACATTGGGQKCSSEGCLDADIASTVQASLDRHPEFGPSGQLQVATSNRVVYLYGSVANDLQLADANSIASRAGGDAKIVSSIAVSEK